MADSKSKEDRLMELVLEYGTVCAEAAEAAALFERRAARIAREQRDETLAAIRSFAQEAFRDAPQWLPIESAPKHCTVLLAEGDYVDCGFWHDGSECHGSRGGEGWFSEDDRANLLTARNIHPTHWMPLPPPPAAMKSPQHPKEGRE